MHSYFFFQHLDPSSFYKRKYWSRELPNEEKIWENHIIDNRVRQSRDFDFLFSSWFHFRFHSWLASASRRSFTAVCKQVAKLLFWETQQGFANDCSSLNIACIYMKYKIFAMHSMTLRFSRPRMVQNRLWTSELRRWASESTFRSVRDNQDNYKQREMSEMFKICKSEGFETSQLSITTQRPGCHINALSHSCDWSHVHIAEGPCIS